MKILQFDDRPPEFWVLTGQYFAQRKYRREMPYLIDDDGYVWFVAVDGDNTLGLGSVHIAKDYGVLSGLYVKEEHRGNGVAKKLIKKRLQWCIDAGLKKSNTTASPDSKPLFEKIGFMATRTRGQYTIMEVTLDGDSFRDDNKQGN